MKISKKLLEYKKAKGLSWEKFSEKLPIKGNSLRVAFDRNSVDEIYLKMLAEEFLIDEYKTIKESSEENELNKNKNIPFYDTDAIGGDEAIANMEGITQPSGMINIGDLLGDSDSAMRVYGNSMIPSYPPGCVVGLKIAIDKIIQWGNVYVIETEDNRYIKRLFKNEKGLECHSDNDGVFSDGPRKGKPYYDYFVIPFGSVKRVHRVVGVIKRNENSFLI